MVKAILGYVSAILGIIGIALVSFEPLKEYASFIPADVNNTVIIIAGAVLVIVGIILIYFEGGATKSASELPIYHGKKIIGYRRH